MTPIIGILAEVDNDFNTRVQPPYIKAIELAGGLPVLLPYVEDSKVIEQFVELCDGFFFTGGADVDPMRYGEERKETCGDIQYNRDKLEFRVLEKVMSTSKPILAVCRGAQLVNAALGGTLYQDIPSEIDTSISHRQSEPKFSFSHDINVMENTPLHTLAGVARIRGNSFHHQSIKTLGEGLEIMATSDDGVVEAAYLSGERYLRAYQWHPERLCESDKHNRLIFDDFIKACKQFDF